jgi:hypothetical protein
VIAVHGDRFLIAEGAKLRNLDELDEFLRAGAAVITVPAQT